MEISTEPTHCGFIAIIGRPNVGKSSLLNKLLSKKVSITSYRPQTTQRQILGIKTTGSKQIVFVDTPGIHLNAKKVLNRQMNKAALNALIDVNAVVFLVEALKWTEEDTYVAQALEKLDCPIMVAVNKIDLVPEKDKLLSFIQEIAKRMPRAEIIPISVKKGIQLDEIEAKVEKLLPESPFYFPPEQSVNHSERFHISEVIREKIMRQFEKEVPYSVFVQVDTFEKKERIIDINVTIFVERQGQKAILIGAKGQGLKEVGTKARIDLERYFDKKVCLKCWVKVSESWSDNARALKSLGFQDNG